MTIVLNVLLFIAAFFLILLVLVQRGRGGGLAGALGGAGGQSAFGTKAGDVFTKITIVTAAVWILLCAAAVKMYRPDTNEETFSSLKSTGATTSPGPQLPGPAATGTADSTSAPAPTGTAAAPAASTPEAAAPAPTGTAPAAGS